MTLQEQHNQLAREFEAVLAENAKLQDIIEAFVNLQGAPHFTATAYALHCQRARSALKRTPAPAR